MDSVHRRKMGKGRDVPKPIYSVATLADHWGCGTDTVYTLVKSGELQHFKLGGKLIRIRADEVERYERRPSTARDDNTAFGERFDDATVIRLERLIGSREASAGGQGE